MLNPRSGYQVVTEPLLGRVQADSSERIFWVLLLLKSVTAMGGFEQEWKEYKRLRNTFFIILFWRCPYFCARCSLVREALSLYCSSIRDCDGVVCGVLFQRCPTPTLAVPTLWGVVFCNLVVQQEFSCPTMRALRTAEIPKIVILFVVTSGFC